jgi:hypothetical protein
MESEEFTKEEMRWMNRLERCLKAAPKSLDVVVYHGSVGCYNVGAVAKTYEIEGDMDNVDDHCTKQHSIITDVFISGDSTM